MSSENKDWFYGSEEFQSYFKQGNRSLVIKANLPHFTVMAVSDKYLALVHKQRSEVLNYNLFEVFPGSAADPSEKNSVFSSFKRVIDNKQTDELPVFKYEIYNEAISTKETEYLTNVNEPIFNNEGNVAYLINTTTNITQQVLSKQAIEETDKLKGSLQREQALNEELRVVNEELHNSQKSLYNLNNELEERITSRTKALFESESRLQKILDTMAEGVGIVDTTGKILYVNPKGQRILGITESKIIPHTYQDPNWQKQRLDGTPLPLAEHPLSIMMAKGTTVNNYELAVQPPQGNRFYLSLTATPLHNEKGIIIAGITTFMDVTSQIKYRETIQNLNEELATANEELASSNEEYIVVNEELLASNDQLREMQYQVQKAEEQMRFAIEAASLGTWYIDAATREFIPSPRLKELFGYYPSEVMSYKAAIKQITDDYRDIVTTAVEEAITGGKAYDIEYSITGFHDKKLRWVRAFGKLYPDNTGVLSHFSGVLIDITEQKQDEQRKNDFIGMVSHEMKTPLTTLSTYLHLLQSVTNVENSIAINMLNKSNQQVNKLIKLINGFLNISRLESGKIYIDRKRFDLAILINEAEEEVNSTINSHKVIFAPVQTTYVDADRDKINQVVTNLISNAIKYSAGNTVINVICVTVGSNATVSVKDEGIGIKDEDKSKIFDRYYRVHDGNHNIASGFGIGLYLCSEIIQRHDGKIGVESEVGKGSTFYFSLPVIQE